MNDNVITKTLDKLTDDEACVVMWGVANLEKIERGLEEFKNITGKIDLPAAIVLTSENDKIGFVKTSMIDDNEEKFEDYGWLGRMLAQIRENHKNKKYHVNGIQTDIPMIIQADNMVVATTLEGIKSTKDIGIKFHFPKVKVNKFNKRHK